MTRVAALFGVVGLLAALGGWPVSAAPPADPPKAEPKPVEWSADMQTVADGHNQFALELYAKLAEKEKGKNVFFSPYSVHTALGMTTTGAKGDTRDEMVKVLHLPDGDKMLASGDLGSYYTRPRKDFQLSVANALWGQKGFPWRAEWLDLQNKRFGAGFNVADFGQAEAERKRINKWVEDQTKEKIKELLLPGQLTGNTKMVLTNAVYFKGTWVTQFDPKKTRDAKFHCADDKTVDVKMMHGNMKCGYARRPDGTTMVSLPYQGGELDMVVILPKLPDGLPALEKQLTPKVLTQWLGELKDQASHEVYLPRFKLETRYELPEHLQALGMKAAFKPGADFTGMATTSPGWITGVTHKGFVEVNEEGTEAAAATAVIIGDSKFPPPFHADHPFVFVIRDVKKGTILFMGRVEKP